MASLRTPDLNDLLPSSLSLSTSLTRFRNCIAGSCPGSSLRADWTCWRAWGSFPVRNNTRPRVVNTSGELGANRSASLWVVVLELEWGQQVGRWWAHFALAFAPSQLPLASSSSILHIRHSMGISPPSPSIPCKHLSKANLASVHSFFFMAAR